jgi:hypothetical protein
VRLASGDGSTEVDVEVEVSDRLPESDLFAGVGEASRFFERGSVGYSAIADPTRFDGLQLHTDAWSVAPVTVLRARSSFFEDETRIPDGSAALDCALLMRRVPVRWFAPPSLRSAGSDHADAVTADPRCRHPSTMAARAARGSDDDRLGLVPAAALLRLKRGAGRLSRKLPHTERSRA